MELVQQKVHVKQTEDTGEEEEWMGLGTRSWVTGQGDRRMAEGEMRMPSCEARARRAGSSHVPYSHRMLPAC